MAQEYVLIKHDHSQNYGQIAVSKSVIERIVVISIDEVEGVVLVDRSFTTTPISIKLAKSQLSITVEVKLDYGKKVEEVCEKLQSKILQTIELMIGYKLAIVDIKVSGFTFN